MLKKNQLILIFIFLFLAVGCSQPVVLRGGREVPYEEAAFQDFSRIQGLVTSQQEDVALGEIDRFESEFSNYCGVKHTIGTGNGLDALTLIIRGYKELGIFQEGDEILVPANTYIASILSPTK